MLDLVDKQSVASSLYVWCGFDLTPEEKKWARRVGARGAVMGPGAHAAASFVVPTDSRRIALDALVKIWPQIAAASTGRTIKRIGVVLGNVEPAGQSGQQLDLFGDPEAEERERRRQQTISAIKRKYGKNYLLKGMDLLPAANARERNTQIGGHRAGA